MIDPNALINVNVLSTPATRIEQATVANTNADLYLLVPVPGTVDMQYDMVPILAFVLGLYPTDDATDTHTQIDQVISVEGCCAYGSLPIYDRSTGYWSAAGDPSGYGLNKFGSLNSEAQP